MHKAALVAGHTTSFTPSRPWGCALQAAMDETNWWRSELEEPALLALTKSQALGQLIAGDAAVANMHPSRPSHHVMGAAAGAARSPSGAPPAKKQKKAGKGEQAHNLDANGRCTTNRQGALLCPGYQDGTCSSMGARCRAGVNQCNICLIKQHGAKGHGQSGQGKGAGGGKGHGGGKKGGRGKGKY